MDALHDASHRTWYQIGTQFEKLVPDYVGNATLPTKEAEENMGDRDFADEGRRLFPIDSPAATWLSAAYFAKNASECYRNKVVRDAVAMRIKHAAATYGIAADVDVITSAMSAPVVEKSAAEDDSNYGWVQTVGNHKERRFAMFDATGVKKAAAYFIENRNKYPFAVRKTIATNILHKAAEHKVVVGSLIRKEAGVGFPRKDTLMAELLERAYLYKDAEVAQAMANLNEAVIADEGELTGEALDKLAELVNEFDRLEGMETSYGKKLLSPSEFIYDIDPKVAEDLLSDSVELDKHVFSLSKLAELPEGVFASVLGDDFVTRVKTASGSIDKSKLSDELYSLPKPDKAALEEHLELSFT